MNATASASSVGGDVAGFGGDTPGSDGVGLGAPKNGNTEVGVDCADLGAASNAEGEVAGTAGGWAVNMNGFDAVVPAAPKPTNAPNLGGASSALSMSGTMGGNPLRDGGREAANERLGKARICLLARVASSAIWKA
jgi:hypothetical protein